MAPKCNVLLDRHMPQENIHRKRNRKRCKRVFYNSPTEDLDSYEGVQSVAMDYREPTMYDVLLTSLGLSNKVVADMKKRRGNIKSSNRQREEESKRDTEGNEDEENSRSTEDQSSRNGEDDEIQALGSLTKNTNEKEDCEYCETDEEHELSTNSQSSVTTSAFSEHLTHKLSSEEVKTLLKGKWKFNWEAFAIGKTDCSWKGTRPDFLDVAQNDATYGLKPKLFKHWLQLYEKSGGKDFGSSTRRRFFSMCNSSLDILHSNKRPFYKKGHGEDSSHMDATLCILNDIFKTKDLVQKNESKIAKHCEEETLSDDTFREQGFTRPKVLILLPYRSIAFRAVNRLIQLTPESQRVNVLNLPQFNDEFGCDDDGNHVKTSEKRKSEKPSDWQALIGEGNSDDAFMLGIKYTRKSIRLDTRLDTRHDTRLDTRHGHSDIYFSDMIIASPVELVMAIGRVEENKDENVDYLSSIEVLVIDHADVISMQSWRNIDIVVKQLNRMPLELHDTNIMRVRRWYLDGDAQFYRESINLSSYLTAEINSLFNQLCLNYKGKMKMESEYESVLQSVFSNVCQIYERFDADSMTDVDNARLEFFAKQVFPRIRDSVQGGVMIFSNSYMDLVRIRRVFDVAESLLLCS